MTLANTDRWATTEIIPDLGPADLHVFRVNLPANEALEQQCLSVLSPEERDKVARFKHDLSRSHALIGRGVLRHIAGHLLDVPAPEVAVSMVPNGKPEIDGLSMNVAHSGNIILVAVARSGLVGVDVERVNSHTSVLEIADRFFAPSEVAQIRSSFDEGSSRATFFRLWTRKESVIKADGRGLSVELSSFAAEDFTRIPGTAKIFRVHTLPMDDTEYAGALATTDLDVTPRLFFYPSA